MSVNALCWKWQAVSVGYRCWFSAGALQDVVLPLHHQRIQVLPPGAEQNPEVQLRAEDSDGYGLLWVLTGGGISSNFKMEIIPFNAMTFVFERQLEDSSALVVVIAVAQSDF